MKSESTFGADVRKVFSFTLKQMLQMKSNRGALLVLFILAFISVPVMSILAGGSAKPAEREAYYSVSSWEEYEEETARAEEELARQSSQSSQQIYSMVMMMVTIMSVAYIINAVVEEKSSKLVETLMVSLRPLSLLAGKICSIMVYVLILLAVFFCGMGLSYFICGRLMNLSASYGLLAVFSGGFSAGLGVIPVLLVSLILGFAAFSLLSGLAGAGCSTSEDTGAASIIPMFAVIISYMLGTILPMTGANVTVLSLIPFISAFLAPCAWLAGSISFVVLAVSWIIQAAAVCLLAWLASRVYRDLLVYSGERRGLGKIFAMAFSGTHGDESVGKGGMQR